MFCHDILRCLQDMAPWMVQIVYRDTSLDNQHSDLWTSDGGVAAERRSKKFFDGTYFLDSGNGSAGTAHMPLSHGPFCLNEASPRGILRMANLFKSFKAASRPGCVVLTVIDK